MATANPPTAIVGAQPDQAAALAKLKIWGKLAKGDLHTITKRDVEDLFGVLDAEEKGEISRDELLVLRQIPDLNLTTEDIEVLVNDADKDNSGKVSQEELFKALTQGEIAYNVVLASLGQKRQQAVKTTECEKDDLIDWLRVEYQTNSALWSLPQTIVLFIVFVVSMTVHLNLTTAFQMQNGLLGEIEGEGPPYLHKYVHDVPTFWEWMEQSFLSSHFKNDLNVWPYPGRVASYNQIIGGVQIARLNSEPATCAQSEVLGDAYDSRFNGRCHKQEDSERTDTVFLLYHMDNAVLLEEIRNLTRMSWVDQNTTHLDVGILFYNGHMEAFTAHHLTFYFQPDGVVKVLFSMETYMADPYNNILWLIPDVIFGVILLRMFYSEMLEMVPACMNGLDGFFQYMEFWNIIDWFSIIFGALLMGLWGHICAKISSGLQSQIASLNMGALDDAVLANNTFLSTARFEQVMPRSLLEGKIGELHTTMDDVQYLHEWLRRLVFFYNFVLMMKFFKAFQANPRLNIVIKTMQTSAIDIIHFVIVFFVIFFVFSSAAYVYFGGKIKAFSSHTRSLMMCWRILMGDFDVESMELVDQQLAYIWTLVFQFLVLLILLNMLLAIIMDTYAAVNEPGSKTIWDQIREAVRTARETRGHVDMWYLICQFEDEDYQAHPGNRVTSKSLRRAFESQKMSKHNADYLIRRTAEYVKAQEGKVDLKMSDAVRLISRMNTTVLRTAEATEQTLELLKEERRRPQEARFDAIMAGQDPDSLPHGKRGPPQPQRFPALPGAVPLSPHKLGNEVTPGTNNRPMALTNGSNFSGGWGNRSGSLNGSLGVNPMQLVVVPPSMPQPKTLRPEGLHGADIGAGGMPDMPSTAGSRRDSLASMREAGAVPGAPTATELHLSVQIEELQASVDGLRQDQARAQEAMLEELRHLRNYMEDRDTWLEQRLNALDRRSEKVERGNDRVSAAMQGFDFGELMQTTGRILQAQQRQSSQLQQAMVNARGSDNLEGNQLQAVAPADGGPRRALDNSSARRLEHQVEQIGDHVQQLLAHAEESAEMRKLLWKIDLNLRQLRNSAAGANNQQEPPKTPQLQTQASLSNGFAKAAASSRRPLGGDTPGGPSRLPRVPTQDDPGNQMR